MEQKILIVDDEAHIRMLIEQTLEELEDEGVEFLTAENGEIALDIIQKENRVKKELELNNVFIVLLTAKGQELDRQRGQEVGADVYMTKPFDPEIILSKAKEVLGIE